MSKPFGIIATEDVVVSEKRANEGQRWSKKKLFIFRSSHPIDGVLHCDLKPKTSHFDIRLNMELLILDHCVLAYLHIRTEQNFAGIYHLVRK